MMLGIYYFFSHWP